MIVMYNKNWMFCLFFVFWSISLLSMGEVRVATLNLNGARDVRKRADLFELSQQKKVDVFLVQETHSDLKNETDWLKEWDGLALFSHNTSLSGGVAILFSKSFLPQSYVVEEIIKGRLLKVRAAFENDFFVFICIYSPTLAMERMCFLDKLSDVLSTCDSNDFLVLGGDFNCTADVLDRNHVEPHVASRKRLNELLEAYELNDIWRSFHRNQRQYSWTHCRDNFLSMARLDRMYCFKHFSSAFRSSFIIPVGFSDHCMVCCVITKRTLKPSSAYWHFNKSLLDDNEFKEAFVLFWENFKLEKPFFTSLQQWWDVAKIQIKQLCQEYTFNVSYDLSRSMKIIESEIIELQNLVENTGNFEYVIKLKSKKKDLADLLKKKTQGALVRSRFQNVSEMDVPSKFFFNMEQKNGRKKFIHAVRTESGELLSNPSDIRRRARSFYSNLFKSELVGDGGSEQDFLNDLPKLTEDSAKLLDDPLSLKELYTALMGMENGRAPGIDGLPVEFFKVFWSVLGKDLQQVLNTSVKRGRLPLSCRRAVLTLLPKSGDLTDLKQWRPVSLLCIDVKILSKALATRLSKVMGQIIHVDQTYCVPERSIFDNIFLVRDVIEFSRRIDKKFGLVFMDQEKAFDRVEHKYLWKVLKAFGFNLGFIRKIRVLYNDIESLLKVNGGLCQPFKALRGIRQGCSLSGMLYSLAIEPLLHKLREKMSGFSLNNDEKVFCLSAYADDLVVVVNDQNDIDTLNNLVRDFGSISSAKVNWKKSEAIQFGNWQENLPKLPDGLEWKKGSFKYLGVFLGDDNAVSKNWDGVVEKTKGRLKKWMWLLPQMSYRGRCLVINNLVASVLWHRLAVLDPPSGLLAKIQSSLIDFFWDKMHWIPQCVLHLSKEEGGQGLIHLPSRTAAFRLQFIQKFLTGPNDLVWRPVASKLLHYAGGLGLDESLFLMNPQKVDVTDLPAFYQGLFKVWAFFKVHRGEETVSLYRLLEEPLIFGSRMDISMTVMPALNKYLCKAGIISLRQLVEITGPLMDSAKLAERMGLKSLRVADQLLNCWKTRLEPQERAMLKDYSDGFLMPNGMECFPELVLSPNLDDCDGPFLVPLKEMELSEIKGQWFYRSCVKVINKMKLNGRIDTPWRSTLGLLRSVKPEWRSLYKPPLTKKGGDLQWRILHGILAVNSFICVLNPNVSHECVFCLQRETVFHAFLNCPRLNPLFMVLTKVFQCFGVSFSSETFILGFKYAQKERCKCQLINFILGNGKMAIYISRKNKVEKNSDHDVVEIFMRLVKSRVKMEFDFFAVKGDLDVFEDVWCQAGAICSLENDDLVFSTLFL